MRGAAVDVGQEMHSETRAGQRQLDAPVGAEQALEGGLGLAAVRRTAAAYHGRISFKTTIGRGSKFVLALPLRD